MTSAPFTPSRSSVISIVAPDSFAYSSHLFHRDSEVQSGFGATIVTSTPILAHPTRRLFATLLRPSPRYATFRPFRCPNSSFMVRSIARHCVGCVVSVRPFHTGTPLYSASTSAYLCSNPRNSIPSNILPSTRAVSSILSLSPNWISLPARYVGIPPSSCAPTVNAHLVLVDGFSKIRAMFFPSRLCPLIPAFFFAFNSPARSTRYSISAGV